MKAPNTNETPPPRGRRKPNGRAGARHNALKHGLWARDVVLIHEDPRAFDAYLTAFQDHLQPQGPLEEGLVQIIVACLWRYWRSLRVEAAAMDNAYEDTLAAGPDCYTPDERRERALIASVNNPHLENVHRAQATIERHFHRNLRKLEARQAARGVKHLSLPPSATLNPPVTSET